MVEGGEEERIIVYSVFGIWEKVDVWLDFGRFKSS